MYRKLENINRDKFEAAETTPKEVCTCICNEPKGRTEGEKADRNKSANDIRTNINIQG